MNTNIWRDFQICISVPLSKKNVYVIILKLITCWEVNQVTSIYQMDFLDNTCKKGLKKKKRTSSNFQSSKFQISGLTHNFDFLKQICHKKGLSLKNKNSWHHHWVLHIWVRLCIKFQLKLTMFIFCFQPKTDAKNSAHWVLHIRINLVSKFFPEQTNLNLWTRYAQKRYLGPKPA